MCVLLCVSVCVYMCVSLFGIHNSSPFTKKRRTNPLLYSDWDFSPLGKPTNPLLYSDWEEIGFQFDF